MTDKQYQKALKVLVLVVLIGFPVVLIASYIERWGTDYIMYDIMYYYHSLVEIVAVLLPLVVGLLIVGFALRFLMKNTTDKK